MSYVQFFKTLGLLTFCATWPVRADNQALCAKVFNDEKKSVALRALVAKECAIKVAAGSDMATYVDYWTLIEKKELGRFPIENPNFVDAYRLMLEAQEQYRQSDLFTKLHPDEGMPYYPEDLVDQLLTAGRFSIPKPAALKFGIDVVCRDTVDRVNNKPVLRKRTELAEDTHSLIYASFVDLFDKSPAKLIESLYKSTEESNPGNYQGCGKSYPTLGRSDLDFIGKVLGVSWAAEVGLPADVAKKRIDRLQTARSQIAYYIKNLSRAPAARQADLRAALNQLNETFSRIETAHLDFITVSRVSDDHTGNK